MAADLALAEMTGRFRFGFVKDWTWTMTDGLEERGNEAMVNKYPGRDC